MSWRRFRHDAKTFFLLIFLSFLILTRTRSVARRFRNVVVVATVLHFMDTVMCCAVLYRSWRWLLDGPVGIGVHHPNLRCWCRCRCSLFQQRGPIERLPSTQERLESFLLLLSIQTAWASPSSGLQVELVSNDLGCKPSVQGQWPWPERCQFNCHTFMRRSTRQGKARQGKARQG